MQQVWHQEHSKHPSWPSTTPAPTQTRNIKRNSKFTAREIVCALRAMRPGYILSQTHYIDIDFAK